jgi:hypothetical protein
MTDREHLRKAIRDLRGVHSTHVRSVPVHETFQGETVWEGAVEVFALKGHRKAGLAYAWSHETDTGGQRYVAVLGVDPIKSALDAVRASIAAEYQKTKQGSSRD